MSHGLRLHLPVLHRQGHDQGIARADGAPEDGDEARHLHGGHDHVRRGGAAEADACHGRCRRRHIQHSQHPPADPAVPADQSVRDVHVHHHDRVLQ